MASQIQEGDIGTKLLITITDDGSVVNISSASNLSIFIKKPDGSVLNRSGTLETNGTDGKMYYATIYGDIDTAGIYKIQGHVTLLNGSFFTSTATFKVYRNL